jgi:hypothetical protein
MLGLRVIDQAGNPLSIERSIVRYTVFCIPFLMNGLLLPISSTPALVMKLLGLAVFGLGSSTVYLLIFNRSTRQGLHDLSVRSFVAEAQNPGPVFVKPIWDVHWVVAVTLFLLLGVGPMMMGSWVVNWGPFPQMFADARLVEGLGGLQQAGVNSSTLYSSNGTGGQKILEITIRQMGKSPDEEVFAASVARLI